MRKLSQSLEAIFRAPRQRAVDPHRKARETAKPIIAKLGINLEKLKEGGFNVWPPKAITGEVDPYEGDHYATDWSEVLEMVQDYEKLIEEQAKECRLTSSGSR